MAVIYRVFKRLDVGGAELLYEGESENQARHFFDYDDTHPNMRLSMAIENTGNGKADDG